MKCAVCGKPMSDDYEKHLWTCYSAPYFLGGNFYFWEAVDAAMEKHFNPFPVEKKDENT